MDQPVSNARKWVILVITTISVFMSTLDGSIVNNALPVISQRMQVSISTIQWVVTAYQLAIVVLLLIFGKLSDLYGKKGIFSAGYLLFAIGSAMCGFSGTLVLLVLSRVVQAIGAAAMMSLSQGIITTVFPPNERGKALGFNGTMVALGSMVGPSLGGILVNAFGWESIFYINIPIGVAGAVLAFTQIPQIFEKEEDKRFDFAGSGLFTVFVLALFLGLLFVQDNIISTPYLIPFIAVSAAAIAAFIIVELRKSNPLIDLRLFKIHEFSMGLCTAYFGFIALNSTLLFMPFYLQLVQGYSPLESGLIVSIYPITTAIVAPISGWLSDKITYRPLTVAGMVISTVALFLLSLLTAGSSRFEVMGLLALLGVGIAVFQSPNNSSIMGSVPRPRLGIAGGINALARNLGFVSGTTFSVLIFSFVTSLNMNNLSGGSVNKGVFMTGLTILLRFDAVCCLIGALLSTTRAIRFRGGKKEVTENSRRA